MTDTANDLGERIAEALQSLVEQVQSEAQETSSAPDISRTIQVSPPATEYPNAGDISGDTPANDRIPENSETILMDSSTSRFSGAVWYKKVQEQTVTIAGLGGIGSYVCFLLSRMKPQAIALYDFDDVEEANMSGQLYSQNDIGRSKILAMTDMMHLYSGFHNVIAHREGFTEDSPATNVMICGFDNMTARRDFFNVWYAYVQRKPESERKHCLFIDGRLAAEELQVLCIKGDDTYNIDRCRKEWLFSDSEAEATLCSYKQTTFMANMIGSIITNLFVNFCANDLEGDERPMLDRDLPFLTTYDASMMMFTTEG